MSRPLSRLGEADVRDHRDVVRPRTEPNLESKTPREQRGVLNQTIKTSVLKRTARDNA